MDHTKEEIIKMVERMNNKRYLDYIHRLLKTLLEEQG